MRRAGCLAAALLFAALIVPAVSSVTVGQETAGEAEVRIVARKAADGRVEFALQQRRSDDSWGERLLPSQRFFPCFTRVVYGLRRAIVDQGRAS